MADNSLDYNSIEELPDRFWNKIEKTDSCWLWKGSLWDGYGRYAINRKLYLVHRMAYAVLKQKLGDNTQIDHLCRVKTCVNPDHLEEVSKKENIRRGISRVYNTDLSLCPRGHEYDVEKPSKAGTLIKYCTTCRKEKYLERKQKKAEQLV